MSLIPGQGVADALARVLRGLCEYKVELKTNKQKTDRTKARFMPPAEDCSERFM